MNIARFRSQGRVRYGVVEGESVTDIRGSPFRGEVRLSSRRRRLSAVVLLPVTSPIQVFGGVGVNYRDHLAQAEESSDLPFSKMGIQPFPKSNASLTGSGSPIVLTQEAGEAHYEGELVVVIGRRARRISRERALDYVLGYTCGNDVTEKRSWEKDYSDWRAKGLPTWGPVGPWITTHVEPGNLDVTVRLNGRVEHRFNTGDMIHDVPSIVAYISQYTTLFPGDLIFTGTSGSTKAMKPGDVVEVEISGIGTLKNSVSMENE
tara:strand:+ start:696 stop:1481 length:786 start_codon:yes stop_codon:yes gene_type:complete